MFNQKFVDFLKTFNKISNGVVLEYPVTSGKTDCSDIGFKFDISKFDDTQFEGKIGFIDLSSFLNVFNLVEDPEVSMKDGVIVAKDNNSKVTYLTTTPSLMEDFEYPATQFDRMHAIPSVAEFTLSASDIRRIKQAGSSFKDLNAINFKGDDTVTISLTSTGKFNQSSNCFTINKDVETNKNFDLFVKLETFSKLPVLDYTVKVKYNEAKDAFRILFETSIDGFEMFVSTNV